MNSFQIFLLFLAIVPLAISQEPHDTFNTPQHLNDDNQDPPKFIDVDEDMSAIGNDRLLQSTYPKFRIQANFDNLASAPSSFSTYIQNDLIPPVISYFKSALSVKYPITSNLSLLSGVDNVCGLSVPNDLRKGVQADFYILYTSHSDNSNYAATSRSCHLSTRTNRPLIGMSNLNRNQIKTANGDVLVHEKNTNLIMHEFMHTLGFSATIYPFFIGANGKTLKNHIKTIIYDGKQTTVLDVAPLTQRLRKFFGCAYLPGAIMENDGDSSAPSHFEKKLFYSEIMSSGGCSSSPLADASKRISEFSLAVLEGSGWYVPDYSYAEPYYFGEGQGCSFIYGQCNFIFTQFPLEFCTGNNRGCASQGSAGGYCQAEVNSDNCQFYIPNEDFDCENSDAADNFRLPELQAFGKGASSKCFTGTLNNRKSWGGSTSFCFKYICVNTGAATQLQVKVGSKTYACKHEGDMPVDGYYGHIDCPDPISFCSTVGKKHCPKNCMGMGTCVDGVCQYPTDPTDPTDPTGTGGNDDG